MLIDFDNVTLGIRSDLQNQLRKLLNSDIFKGKVSVQRAYADWRRYPQYIVPLSEASIDLIFAPAFGTNKKNATDIRLAIDALELVFTRPEIGTFILLSGDSDFSSLVLKLKEYGKYVIGVGIRESSSDLLIQNCDEYYSYNELTGLAKETEVEHVRQDPWQLVVQAVTQMRQRGDVMRSDRLKQVMQELDPNFDEKDAGFSRFSKFVVEAGQRGLLKLTKMENGQYEVDLGSNANVPPEVEEALRQEIRAAPAPSAPRTGRRPRERAAGTETLTLAASFALLRDALLELNAVGEESTDADQTRERMIERAAGVGAGNDPIFERTRFQRLLRQAHDAGLIDLVKSGEVYLLKLRPQAQEPVAAGDEGRDGGKAHEDGEAPARRRGQRGGRGGSRRGGRGRGRRREDEQAGEGPSAAQGPAAVVAVAAEPPAPLQETKRNPRFRHGSRRGSPPGAVSVSDGQETPASPPPPTPSTLTFSRPAASQGSPLGAGGMAGRSLRLRPGSRGRAPVAPTGAVGATPPAVGTRPPEPPPAPPPASPPRQLETAVPRTETPAEPPSGGLLKRVSSALQRAVRGKGKTGG